MKNCDKCRVSVNTRYDFCPLCGMRLTAQPSESDLPKMSGLLSATEQHDIYPRYNAKAKYNLTLRILAFLSLFAVASTLLINLLTYQGMLWSLLVAAGIAVFWAAVIYPVTVRKNIGHHIAVNAVSVCVFFITAHFVVRAKGWSLDYVVPFLFIAATTFISLVILIKWMKWREYALYQFITIILGLLPVISVLAHLVTTAWPSLVSAVYSFLTLLAMFIFGDKKYKNELIKRFHF
ncbi:hypothetical protein IZU99_05900 [Oscillospiraceae bacterium CM]|nr:hypothetical protein IZU99_05900 [Oscillospiraceae bacterium CM]